MVFKAQFQDLRNMHLNVSTVDGNENINEEYMVNSIYTVFILSVPTCYQ